MGYNPEIRQTTIQGRKYYSTHTKSDIVLGTSITPPTRSPSELLKDSCYIVAGGPSLKGFPFEVLRNKTTIVVNFSVFCVPEPTYFITRDYTFLSKARIASFKNTQVLPKQRSKFLECGATKCFVAGFQGSYLQEESDGTITDTRYGLKYDLDVFDHVIRSRRSDGISNSYEDFRAGGDSGYSALQLAVILGYKNIFLLGLDLITDGADTHFHKRYSHVTGKLNEKLFRWYDNNYINAIKWIHENTSSSVISCSPISRLNQVIPVVNILELLT